MVEIVAFGNKLSCLIYICFLARSFSFVIAFSKFVRKRSFISLAAASVKVTINKESIFTPSSIYPIIRSTNTFVFPDPAEAETNKLSPLCQIACHCSGVANTPSGFTGITHYSSFPSILFLIQVKFS